MASVSLCMIVRDEEDVLRRCLASAAEAVDEIIIVDTGSADRTKEIAAEFTDKIYDFVWRDDFAAARNFAFSKGSGDYLMWLDADDVLPAPDAEKLLAFKAHQSTRNHSRLPQSLSQDCSMADRKCSPHSNCSVHLESLIG